MSRSHRRSIIAVVGVLGFGFGALGSALIYAEHEQQQAIAHQTSGNQHQAGPQQSDTNHAGLPALAERVISNPEPGEGTERERRDLAAQENTAAWAFWMVFLSGLQLIVSGFGLWALLRTIDQGRKALKRARDANRIADDTARRQLRAYVLPIGIEWSFEIVGGERYVSIQVKWQNSGATPGADFTCAALPMVSDVVLTSMDFSIVGPRHASTIGPAMVLLAPRALISLPDAHAVWSGSKAIYLIGKATYKDAFNKCHEAQHCYQISFMKDSEHPLT